MRIFYFFVGLLFLGSCESNSSKQSVKIERAGEPDIYNVKSDDSAMTAAISTAKTTLPQFLRVFQQNNTATTDFAIKVHYDDGEVPEHMWLSNLSYEKGKLQGVVSNVPEYTKQVREGQLVLVDTSKVSDWKYVQHRRLVGGYTIKVLRNTLSPKEKAELDNSVTYKIE